MHAWIRSFLCAPPDLWKPVLSQRKHVSYNKWNWTYVEKRKMVIRAFYPCLVLKRKGQCRSWKIKKCAMNLSFFFINGLDELILFHVLRVFYLGVWLFGFLVFVKKKTLFKVSTLIEFYEVTVFFNLNFVFFRLKELNFVCFGLPSLVSSNETFTKWGSKKNKPIGTDMQLY